MFRFLISLVLIISIANSEVVVKKSTRTVEGVGIGTSRQEAVNNAIVEALGQLNGVYIKKYSFISDTSIENSKGDYSSYVYNNKISRLTKGKVDSFSIIDVIEDNGKYEATVSVSKTKTTKKYKTPGFNPKNRRTLAVIPSFPSKYVYSILGKAKSYREVTQRLTQELVSAVTQTRKFAVLDREANRVYKNEKDLIQEDGASDELLKIGKVLGADYLLTSKISELNISKDSGASSIVGNMSSSFKAYATIQYRIIVMSTRQIKWANTSSFEFEVDGNTREQLFLESLKTISKKITTELIENIYPIKIVNVNSKEITLNQGSLKVGSEFEVFKLGKKIYDSYTKESLGREETKVGKIKVIRSLAKMSVAKVIEGKVLKGNICRTLNTDSSNQSIDITEEDKPSNTTTTESGGVVLPFD